MKTIFNNRSGLFSLAAAVIIATIVAACSATTRENEKQIRLEELKKQHAQLSDEIRTLEAEIAAENPDTLAVRAKDVSVSVLKARPFDHYVQTQGRVESEYNILVSAKTMGVVTAVYVREGQNVSKGQKIGRASCRERGRISVVV